MLILRTLGALVLVLAIAPQSALATGKYVKTRLRTVTKIKATDEYVPRASEAATGGQFGLLNKLTHTEPTSYARKLRSTNNIAQERLDFRNELFNQTYRKHVQSRSQGKLAYEAMLADLQTRSGILKEHLKGHEDTFYDVLVLGLGPDGAVVLQDLAERHPEVRALGIDKGKAPGGIFARAGNLFHVPHPTDSEFGDRPIRFADQTGKAHPPGEVVANSILAAVHGSAADILLGTTVTHIEEDWRGAHAWPGRYRVSTADGEEIYFDHIVVGTRNAKSNLYRFDEHTNGLIAGEQHKLANAHAHPYDPAKYPKILTVKQALELAAQGGRDFYRGDDKNDAPRIAIVDPQGDDYWAGVLRDYLLGVGPSQAYDDDATARGEIGPIGYWHGGPSADGQEAKDNSRLVTMDFNLERIARTRDGQFMLVPRGVSDPGFAKDPFDIVIVGTMEEPNLYPLLRPILPYTYNGSTVEASNAVKVIGDPHTKHSSFKSVINHDIHLIGGANGLNAHQSRGRPEFSSLEASSELIRYWRRAGPYWADGSLVESLEKTRSQRGDYPFGELSEPERIVVGKGGGVKVDFALPKQTRAVVDDERALRVALARVLHLGFRFPGMSELTLRFAKTKPEIVTLQVPGIKAQATDSIKHAIEADPALLALLRSFVPDDGLEARVRINGTDEPGVVLVDSLRLTR